MLHFIWNEAESNGSCRSVQEGIKAFHCKICQKTFGHKHHLKTHIKHFHEKNSKQFKCELCEKEFGANTSLRLHVNVVHKKLLKGLPKTVCC
jgi:uncharacterized Zn-finger protein